MLSEGKIRNTFFAQRKEGVSEKWQSRIRNQCCGAGAARDHFC
jgi:hypothetical protein